MDSSKPPKFKINYFKNKPLDLECLEKEFVSTLDDNHHDYNAFHISKLQSFNPVYSKFFTLTESNYNSIALNHKYHISTLSTVVNQQTKEPISKPVFIKFSPLLDPIRYMIGKYKQDDNAICTLPTYIVNTEHVAGVATTTPQNPHVKIMEQNNAAYTDNFFSYLTSKLLHNHQFVNGLDYYGSYLGIQSKFKMDVTDDLEYLNSSAYFTDNNNKLFSITANESDEFINFGSRANKNKLKINDTSIHNISSVDIINLDVEDIDLQNITLLEEDLMETTTPLDNTMIYEKPESGNSSKSSSSSDSSSSANSETNYSTDGEESADDDDDDSNAWETDDSDKSTESTTSSISSEEEEHKFAFIKNFPVQLICLEKCDGTLDDLFEKKRINIDESASSLFQIIMTLIAYQKAFHFTHNDLHTNNIMYINTDIKYLQYRYKNNVYSVPTYGKIYKIIDFGRSIYKFNGQLFCSDSFAPGGDAATQYNCEPYMNEKKPRLDPNYSFDLTRLGCSLYDFIIEDDDKPTEYDELQKTVCRWCTDDNDKNVLYKKNGDERYPNFKLYKMIARTVHKHTPQEQLEFPFFKQFLMASTENGSLDDIIDLDELPCYV